MPKEITYPSVGTEADAVVEQMATFDPCLMIARGMLPGHTAFRKHGMNDGVGTTEAVISHLQNAAEPWMPLVAQEVSIESDSAQDDVAGSGALTVQINGLDADFNLQSHVFTMDGVTPVVSTGIFWTRVFSSFVVTSGTYRGKNAGQMTVRETDSPGQEILLMPLEHGEGGSSHYCVPAGKTLYVKNYKLQLQSGKEMTFEVLYAPGANVITAPFSALRKVLEFEGFTGTTDGSFAVPFALPEYTDVWAMGVVTAQTGYAFFEYSGTLIDNT
jgi:hypothetical protein